MNVCGGLNFQLLNLIVNGWIFIQTLKKTVDSSCCNIQCSGLSTKGPKMSRNVQKWPNIQCSAVDRGRAFTHGYTSILHTVLCIIRHWHSVALQLPTQLQVIIIIIKNFDASKQPHENTSEKILHMNLLERIHIVDRQMLTI